MIPYPAVRRKAGGARDFLLGFLELGGQFLPVRDHGPRLAGGDGLPTGVFPIQSLFILLFGRVGRPQVHQVQLHRPGAAVFVDLGVKGHVRLVPHRQAGLGTGDGEKDHVHGPPVPAGPHLEMPPAAHVGHTGDGDAAEGKDGLGVACAVGLQHGQGLDLLHGEDGGVFDLPVDLQGGDVGLAPGVLPDEILHPVAEEGDVVLQDGKARGQRMAAVALQ